jgi:hypothetical protein
MISVKEKYRSLCKDETAIPIFLKDWWLDAVCGSENWDVVIYENNEKIIGAFPFLISHSQGFKKLNMPKFTPFLGPWLKYPENQDHTAKLSYEHKILTALIEQLPLSDFFRQRFHYSITNWLPFYWNHYTQMTRYTYVINDISDVQKVYDNFEHSKKKNIKKAEKIVQIKYDLPFEEFYENHKYTLAKQGSKISYSKQLFKSIYEASYQRNQGKTIYAVDGEGNLHGALFVVWDENSAYDLISTLDPDHRNSGASSLLVLEIIKYLSGKTKKFDFEGSMDQQIENSFRKFGAQQVPFFQIKKINSRLLKVAGLFTDF